MNHASLSHLRLTGCLLVAGLLCLPGCRESPPSDPPGPDPAAESGGVVETSDYPRIVRRHIQGGESESVETSGPGAPPNLVEPFFDKLDWTRPEEKPSFAVEMARNDFLKIRLAESSRAAGPVFVATWREAAEPVKQGGVTFEVYTTYRSPPLEGREEAIKLLETFASSDDSYRTAVEWKELPKQAESGSPGE